MSEEPESFLRCSRSIGTLRRQAPAAMNTRCALYLILTKNASAIFWTWARSGAPTLVLAGHTSANIVALDNHAPFLDTLKKRAAANGFDKRIRCVVGDMAQPEFPPDSFVLIWSEGAIACVGFDQGLKVWQPLLRNAGCVAVTIFVGLPRILLKRFTIT
jgi:hypothetical protein